MQFATREAMIKKFGERELIQLTETEAPYLNEINEDKLKDALDAANSEIESYIASRYTLPLQIVPPFLQALACQMTRYHGNSLVMTEKSPIKMQYDAAIKTLKEIAKGTLQLGGSPVGESAPIQSSNNSVVMTIGRHDFGGRGW